MACGTRSVAAFELRRWRHEVEKHSRYLLFRYNLDSVGPRKNPESKGEPKITEAAQKAGVLIRELQSRLRATAELPTSAADGTAARQFDESTDELEEQLQRQFESQSFRSAPNKLKDIRGRVVEGVVDRIMREWEWSAGGKANSLDNEVVERLIQRVLERLNGPSDADH